MAKSKDKHNRLQQLIVMLRTHPEGLRKAEIARRLGVHRSTVGRYIDHLSLQLPVWERNSHVGIESDGTRYSEPHFNIYEGTFILSLIKLYQQEVNIKNPHASSVMRKLAEGFKNSSNKLAEEFRTAAENLDVEEYTYLKGFVENFEKLTLGWINSTAVHVTYLHKSSGESCSTLFEPQGFFTCRNSSRKSDLAVGGICRRINEECFLNVADFSFVEYPVGEAEVDKGIRHPFCPVSEYGLCNRPFQRNEQDKDLFIRESNHRIKNSLFMASGLIDITFADIEDEDLKYKIGNLQSRVNAIALIHEQLSYKPGSDMVELGPFITDLIERAVKIASADHECVKKRFKIEKIQLPSSKALPLGMIIAELVTNSFKHTVAPSLNVGITGLNGIVKLRYSDGGKGFRLDNDADSSGSDIIRNFCRQLDCSISYKKNIFILEFPK